MYNKQKKMEGGEEKNKHNVEVACSIHGHANDKVIGKRTKNYALLTF